VVEKVAKDRCVQHRPVDRERYDIERRRRRIQIDVCNIEQ
jgi:hypothetical protein